MKRYIDAKDYASQIVKAIPKGVLVTTKAGDKVNSMTIGWGTMGIDWSRPVFIAYVRESRSTKQLLEKNGEFTINVPLDSVDRRILSLCGRKSGRDMDKIQKLSLTLEEPLEISVPGIKELPLTVAGKIDYRALEREAQKELEG